MREREHSLIGSHPYGHLIKAINYARAASSRTELGVPGVCPRVRDRVMGKVWQIGRAEGQVECALLKTQLNKQTTEQPWRG